MSKLYDMALIGIIHYNKLSEDDTIKIIDECIYGGADINYNNSEILITMIKRKHIKVINFLIDSGINFRVDSDCPFAMACDRNNIELIKLFLLHNIPANTSDNRAVFLRQINLDTVKLLIDHGMDPFSNNNILFRNAIAEGKIGMINYLIYIKPDLLENADLMEWSFLETKNAETTNILLDCGLDPNIIPSSGKCFLETCISNYNFDRCKLLLEHGADINLCGVIKNEDNVSDRKKEKLLKIINLCLEYGLDLNKIV